jgi:hypothetical protein
MHGRIADDVTQVYQINTNVSAHARALSINDVNLAALAGVADALSAIGRGDLAAHIVEVMYYCGERRMHHDNIIQFARRLPVVLCQ